MDDAGKPMDSGTNNASSISKFANSGILLFIDQLIVAAGGWAYWLVIPRFIMSSEIGHATTIYSLVLLINTITQLGLEYPLLKKSGSKRSEILVTAIVIELAITAASIPIVLYLANSFYQESQQLAWLAVGILVFSSTSFITRFLLLGLSNAKAVLIFDIVGTGTKFVSGFALISGGYGATGILLSFLLQSVVLTVGTFFVAKRLFGFGIGTSKFGKELIKDGLVNMPSKLSSMFIVSLSVVLLASFGVDSSQVGIFYIAVMVSIVVGSFGSSLAFMSIPVSSEVKRDFSLGSLRIGLAFTAPIISALMAAPTFILSIIGAEYSLAGDILAILALGILPSVILSNSISKFNNHNQSKKILSIGSIRLCAFLLPFFMLVPQYSIIGAAYSILISFSTSALISIIWIEKTALRYIGTAIAAIVAGTAASYTVASLVYANPYLTLAVSIVVSGAIVLALKCTSTKEIISLVTFARRSPK